jgi:hypothetical protein
MKDAPVARATARLARASHGARASPANVKFLGIPVLFIVAPLSIAIFVALAVVSTQYPALVMQGNSANFWWIPAWFAGLIVAGALLYYIPRYVRARRGINVSFVYKELPPSEAGVVAGSPHGLPAGDVA